ncbi:MAG: MATE family efflux transporter [Candidatus Izemoplasmatales bacterium]
MDKKTLIFEKLPIWKAVATLAIPSILSQFVTMIYNLADTFYIGQTNDPYMVAAISYSFGAFALLAAFGNLFGIGGGSLMARMMGAKRPEDAKKVATFSVYGANVFSLLYSVLLWIFMTPILELLGASAMTIGYGRDYLFWTTVVGGLPTTLGIVLGHLLRSEGEAKLGAAGIAFGGILNIILDPIFIFVLDLDVAGAAMATMIANVAVVGFYLMTVFSIGHRSNVGFSPSRLSGAKQVAGPVFAVGLPAAAAVVFNVLVNAAVFKVLSGYGDLAVAAMGIVKKIDSIPLNIALGLGQGVLPLVAYNYAAKDFDRMKGSSRFARFAAVGIASLCIVFFEVFSEPIVTFFIREPETVALGARFLRIACLGTIPMALFFLYNTTFQAMGHGKQSFFLVFMRQVVINLGILFLFETLFGIDGVVWTQPVGDLLSALIAWVLFERVVVSLKKEQSGLDRRSA